MAIMRPLSSIQGDINRLFSELEQEFFSPLMGRRHGGTGLMEMSGKWMPSVDIRNLEKEIEVKASIPGYRPEDIDIEVDEHMITLSGQMSQEEQAEEKEFVRREIVKGSFYRQIPLPVDVMSDQAQASFEHGMLTVRLPKAEQSRKHKIKVNSQQQQQQQS